MKKLVSFYSIALILLMLAVPVLSTGCGCLRQACQPYGPRVTGDGAGGAIAVYEAIRSGNQHDFYVQKISPEGEALWGEEGVLIGSAYKQCDSFHELHIVSDGSGGVIMTWSGSPFRLLFRCAGGSPVASGHIIRRGECSYLRSEASEQTGREHCSRGKSFCHSHVSQ